MSLTPAACTGLDRLPDHPAARALRGRRVAAVVHAVHVLEGLGAEVPVLFGPEHGVWATHQDMEAVPGGRDPHFDRPVLSLYGDSPDTLEPPAGALDEVDAVVADLVDIGTRYYTYAATVAAMARACGARRIPLYVLDRPNPLGATSVEGGPMQDDCRSFVGAIGVPHRHGLTMGQLVRFSADEQGFDAEIVVVDALWDRGGIGVSDGVPWVPPSPNMPSVEAAIIYPGLCLLEATTLSEGRGTTTPFELFGAPGIDPFVLARQLARRELAGVGFRPHVFRPMFGKHAGAACGGVQIVVTQPVAVCALELGAHVLDVVWSRYRDCVDWRAEPYEFVADRAAIDLLTGDARFRETLEAEESIAPLLGAWREERDAFVSAHSGLYGSAPA